MQNRLWFLAWEGLLPLLSDRYLLVDALRVLFLAEPGHDVARHDDNGSNEATYIPNQSEESVGSALVNYRGVI